MLHDEQATLMMLIATITKVRLPFSGSLFWSSKPSRRPLCHRALTSDLADTPMPFAYIVHLRCTILAPHVFLDAHLHYHENLLMKSKISWKLVSQNYCLTHLALLFLPCPWKSICCSDGCLSASRINLQVFHDPLASWIAICFRSQSWVLLHNSLHSCWLWWVLNASASAWHSSYCLSGEAKSWRSQPPGWLAGLGQECASIAKAHLCRMYITVSEARPYWKHAVQSSWDLRPSAWKSRIHLGETTMICQ